MKTVSHRRRIIAVLIFFGMELSALAASPAQGVEKFYIGTYAGAIYQSTLNLGTGTFGTFSQAIATVDPSFMAVTANRKFLYSVNEGPGTVSVFSINATNGNLTLLNSQNSNGGSPAYIAVDGGNRNVIVANYDGGSVTVFPIQTNGKLGTATAHIQDPGASPHAHCITFDASNHFVFVCDLGLEQIRCFRFNPTAGTLATNTTFITSVATGSGPRHLAFDPPYLHAYLICQNSSTIIGFNYDGANGILSSFQTISTLPPAGFSGNLTAEIAVHPSGKFLYGSNRGYNTIVVYTINPADGALTQVQQQTTGTTPRNFAIDPTGAYCIVAGQDSNDVRLYTINPQTGLLTDTGKKLAAPSPVCILPFILKPPQTVIAFTPTSNRGFEIDLTNTLELLTYQLYESPALSSGTTWNLLATGARGQTRFVLTNSLAEEFFRVGVLTNY